MAKVAINVLVPEDVRDGIKAKAVDGKSQGDVVTEAYRLLEASEQGDLRQKMFETMRRIEDTLESLATTRPVAAAVLAADAVVTREVLNAPAVSTEMRGWPITCKHCGDAEGRGSSKFATICFGCKASGHTGDQRDCPKCTLDYGTGAL